MEEYGQPMHAYDYDTLAGGKIVVRRAKDGEKFMTLDGQERTLDSDMLMICDGEKAVGLAGIMGGENSKITDDVKTCYLKLQPLTAQISERQQSAWVFVQMLPVSLKRA